MEEEKRTARGGRSAKILAPSPTKVTTSSFFHCHHHNPTVHLRSCQDFEYITLYCQSNDRIDAEAPYLQAHQGPETSLHALMSNQDGLEWVEGPFGLEPYWTREPEISTISQIVRKHLNLSHGIPVDVVFHSKGAFTKLYKISTPDVTYLMRISLAVDPIRRTESAVATMDFARQKISIPAPYIIAYSSDNSNELGFEWILMDMVPGTTLHQAWRKMPWDAKEAVVKQLAEHQAQLFEHKFQKIGNLHRQADKITVDQLVTTIFYQGDHLTHNVVRGPFTSSHEWLKARLQLILADQQRILDTSCDEDEIEDAEFAHGLAKKLFEILPTVFLPNVSANEPTVLFHGNLSMQNIMVDEAGKLAMVMDWECVSAVPQWRACQLTSFLEGPMREEKPDRNNYAPDSDEENEDDDGLDNEGITDLYWEHLLEYERNQLALLFLKEMGRLKPDWLAIMKQSKLKADFEKAIQDCDNGWRNKVIKQWVDLLVMGNPGDFSLTDMLYQQPEVDQTSQTSMDWEES